jgi:hypothetical protein
MRYRIQIEELLDATLVVVTSITAYGGRSTHDSKLYTLDAQAAGHGGLVEILGWLQEQVASTTP